VATKPRPVKNDLAHRIERVADMPDETRRALYLSAIVSEALKRAGLRAVLVGGSAVQFYTSGAYETGDIDMVSAASAEELTSALQPLVFVRETDARHWRHPAIPIPIEFPPSPASVGPLLIRTQQLHVQGLTVEMVTLEDAILDRVVAAQEWRDQPSAQQAILMMLAHYQRIDWQLLHARASQASVLKTFERLQRTAKRRLRGAPK